MSDESRKSEPTDHAELRLKSGKHSMEHNLQEDYDLIRSTENLKLYRNRAEGFEAERLDGTE